MLSFTLRHVNREPNCFVTIGHEADHDVFHDQDRGLSRFEQRLDSDRYNYWQFLESEQYKQQAPRMTKDEIDDNTKIAVLHFMHHISWDIATLHNMASCFSCNTSIFITIMMGHNEMRYLAFCCYTIWCDYSDWKLIMLSEENLITVQDVSTINIIPTTDAKIRQDLIRWPRLFYDFKRPQFQSRARCKS
jgi:hypothetical protein